MEILLCRHGETDTNVRGKTHTSGDQVGLNDVGRLQSSKLASVAAMHNVRAIFTSPEKRAIESAQIVGQSLGCVPTIVPDLRERDWGEWSGEPWSEIAARLSSKTLDERYSFAPPRGESWERMEQRLKRAVDKIAQKTEGNSMIVTHGGALRALIPVLKREERARSLGYDFDNASVTIFSYALPDVYKVLAENDTTHL